MDSNAPLKTRLIGQIFQQHHAWLRARLTYWTGCSHSAEDLAAETFLKVWTLPDPGAIREPRALLTTIAQRLMYERWRRRDREKACLDEMTELTEPLHASPHEQLLLMERLSAIDRQLDGLSGQAKAVFMYSQLDGMTYAQIGQRLGLSLGRIHQLMTLALACFNSPGACQAQRSLAAAATGAPLFPREPGDAGRPATA
ncbi:RNA polymerase sigma factor [Pseudomonas sp. M47T1]|nr:RNA polymerase sigma factor [Pseudomonas sp. M47T1]